MAADVGPPRISVIIPTFNRSELLRRTLWQLTRQSLPAGAFEVIVSDDGSSDPTEDVVRSFADRLRIRYLFQEDLGFRAGTARNAGARAATAPVLCFLDTGAMAGREFLSRHLAYHTGDAGHNVVIGYAYGYNPVDPLHELRDLLARKDPDDVFAALCDDAAFLDIRHEQFTRCGFDLDRRAVPWSLLFTVNCSVRAEDFRAVGGFDEDFRGWGAEDMELGFRLFRRGLGFRLARDAWVVESPVERDFAPLMDELKANMGYCLRKHPEPVMEVGYTLLGPDRSFMDWNDEYAKLLLWSDKARDIAVVDEIVAATRELPAGARVAVVGSGGSIPASLPGVVAMDFDPAAVAAARTVDGGRHQVHHVVGLRTPLADSSVDTVVITSRLSGLWGRWKDDLLSEARRIGRGVNVNFACAG